jgi:N-acetylglucosamine-6-sulfatase
MWGLVLPVLLFLSVVCSSARAQVAPHDVVLIVTDDQAYHTLDYMPHTRALLADAGVTFSNFTVSLPWCCPSRATILTGLYAHNHGVLTNGGSSGLEAFDDSSTLPVWLQDGGYRTGFFGRYFNGYSKIAPYLPPGWDEFHAIGGGGGYLVTKVASNGILVTYPKSRGYYSTSFYANKVIDFIKSTPARKRLFAYFATFAPHRPFVPAREDNGTFRNVPGWRSPNHNEQDVSDKPQWVRNLGLWSASRIAVTDSIYRKQLETLQAVDRAVRDIVAALQETGRLANTALIFTSDNGFALGAHRYMGKNCVYEECVRVPMVVRAPGVLPRIDENLVQNIDIAPTIAKWAAVSPARKVNGTSFAQLLRNPGTSWRQESLLELPASAQSNRRFHAVRTQRYVYVELLTGERELYDLAADPWQLKNVVRNSRYGSVVANLRAKLQALKQE